MPKRILSSPEIETKPIRKKRSVRVSSVKKKKTSSLFDSGFNSARVANGVLVSIIVFILWSLVYAATPSPGHPWAQVGDGTWAATGTSILRTFTFPDASATVMTTLDTQQGDIIYGSAASTTTRLPKDTNSTRYLSNTGTSNNPAWSLINLTNGVSGILPFGNGGTGNAFTFFGGPTAFHTYTLPDATATVLTDFTDVTVPQGGTASSSLTGGNLIVGAGANPVTGVATGTDGSVLMTDGGQWISSPMTSSSVADGRRINSLILKNPQAATVTTVYSPTVPTLTATPTNADDPTGAFLGSSTTAVFNNSSGVISGAFTMLRFEWDHDMTVKIKTDQGSVSGVRYNIGMFSATPDGATSTAVSAVFFRYDSGIQPTAFWQTITCTTTCVGAGSTTNTTSVAVTANTAYLLRVKCTNSTSCAFYINGALVATHTTTLPASTQLMGYGVRVTNVATAIRAIRTSYISIVQKN